MAATVLLDLYGTLVEPDWAHLHTGRAALAERMGIGWEAARRAWSSTHLARMSGAYGSLEGDLAAVFAAAADGSPPPIPDATMAELAVSERENWRKGVLLYPDARPALLALRALGIRMAIVTNASAEAAGVIPGLGLQPLIESVFASCEAGVVKPGLFRLAARSLGVEAADTTVVDDEPMQLEAAAELGMKTILVRRDVDGPATDIDGHAVVTSLLQAVPLARGADREPPSRS